MQSEIDDLKLVILELHEALQPFRLYANCVEGMSFLDPVVQKKHQSLGAGAFTNALEVHEKHKPRVQGYYDAGLRAPD